MKRRCAKRGAVDRVFFRGRTEPGDRSDGRTARSKLSSKFKSFVSFASAPQQKSMSASARATQLAAAGDVLGLEQLLPKLGGLPRGEARRAATSALIAAASRREPGAVKVLLEDTHATRQPDHEAARRLVVWLENESDAISRSIVFMLRRFLRSGRRRSPKRAGDSPRRKKR